ncbi:MAG: gluzincin family metallopeptidase [Thermoguttaceae bacterium]
MEARFSRTLLLVALLTISMGARYQTPNFLIESADPQQARQYGDTAERLRKDLAIEWLGQEMPRWSDRCPITINVGKRLGAGGATSFVFDHGEVFGWRMSIQGSHERILDSVLPHEITHMILASHFRRPLPRWADEGAATSVEHIGERMRHRQMLLEFLKTQRGIPFNTMFAMKDYPSDIMPLYAQGFSLSEYLIDQGGKSRFLAFLDEGLNGEQWAEAVRHHYGCQNLGILQNAWLGWVAQGFPDVQPPGGPLSPTAPATMLASTAKRRPEPNLIYRSAASPQPTSPPPAPPAPPAPPTAPGPALGPESVPQPPTSASPSSGQRIETQVSHPSPPQQASQIILEWYRR